MHNLIDKNEPFLRLSCNVARFFGLLLIAFAVLALLGVFWHVLYIGYALHFADFLKMASRIILGLVFPAFLLLGIEQLIKCLIIPDFKPNWVLRFGDKIAYTYAGFLLINFAYSSMYAHKMICSSEYDISFVWQSLIPSGIFTFIKILTWIGIGLFLKRIVPIIQESKTLV
ncbi:MAG: hypothetical protein KAQ89_05880 [Planctomycetes bacterium]|nr:hypothetical protein [Planctomycetota bacterium]